VAARRAREIPSSERFSDSAKVRHLRRQLAGYGGLGRKKLEIMWNFRNSNPFPFKEGGHLQLAYKILEDRRTIDDLLVLQVLGQVNAIVLTDVLHGLGRKQTGIGQNTHRIENMSPRLEITGECPW